MGWLCRAALLTNRLIYVARLLALAPVVLLVLGLAPPIFAQVRTPDTGTIHNEVEAGALSAWTVGIRSDAVVSIGEEIFYGLERGVALALVTRVEFDNHLSVGFVVGRSGHDDSLAGDDANTTDVSLDVGRIWSRNVWQLEAGVLVGYTWLSRAIQVESVGGFVAGGQVRISRAVTDRWDLGLGTALTWSVLKSPQLRDAPPDPDGRAIGRRIRISVSLSYRGAWD